jgi:hypothetical protein
MHLGKSFGQATLVGGGYSFHLSWCRARHLEPHRVRSRQGAEELKVGQLYGSTEQFLCQEAYTVSHTHNHPVLAPADFSSQIHALPDSHKHDSIIDELNETGCTDFQRYWTIILLAPLGFIAVGYSKFLV